MLACTLSQRGVAFETSRTALRDRCERYAQRSSSGAPERARKEPHRQTAMNRRAVGTPRPRRRRRGGTPRGWHRDPLVISLADHNEKRNHEHNHELLAKDGAAWPVAGEMGMTRSRKLGDRADKESSGSYRAQEARHGGLRDGGDAIEKTRRSCGQGELGIESCSGKRHGGRRDGMTRSRKLGDRTQEAWRGIAAFRVCSGSYCAWGGGGTVAGEMG